MGPAGTEVFPRELDNLACSRTDSRIANMAIFVRRLVWQLLLINHVGFTDWREISEWLASHGKGEKGPAL
jgi:hypothetical protein